LKTVIDTNNASNIMELSIRLAHSAADMYYFNYPGIFPIYDNSNSFK